jgi:tRNA threonylcarbamoyladenosine biosynthesis protein TsaE
MSGARHRNELPTAGWTGRGSIVPAVEQIEVTGSAGETASLGARLARLLGSGDVVAVAGELGSGKTTFIRGACLALGVEEPVTSPTFTIGHRYEAPTAVAHLDLYRLNAIGSAEWGALEPYFDGTIAFVEWPDHAGDWLPPARVAVHMEHVDENQRRITIQSEDDLRL